MEQELPEDFDQYIYGFAIIDKATDKVIHTVLYKENPTVEDFLSFVNEIENDEEFSDLKAGLHSDQYFCEKGKVEGDVFVCNNGKYRCAGLV